VTIQRIGFPLAAAVIALGSCRATDTATTAWRGTVDTLANGVVHVTNPADGMWNAETAWQLRQTLRLGNAEGDGPAGFGDIADLLVDATGRMYVLDGQSQDVRVFDSAGTFVRTIGRRGSGPGEFQRAVALRWGPGEQLWVVDFNNLRYSIFDTTGVFLGAKPRASVLRARPWPGTIDADGRVAELVVDQATIAEPAPALLLVRHRFESDRPIPVDTIRVPRDAASYFEHTNSSSGLVRARVPFTAETVWRYDARGFLLSGFTDRLRIVRQHVNGDTARIIDVPHRPAPVAAAEREDAIQALAWFVQEGGQYDESRIPTTKPAFKSMYADPQEYLWITPWESADGGHVRFALIDPDGRYLGVAQADFAGVVSSVLVRGRDLYLVVRGEDDAPYVVRAHIVGRE